MNGNLDRIYWLQTMIRFTDPAFYLLANEQLEALMPIGKASSDRRN